MDLREEMSKRRLWLFETQLRRLNTSTFRGVAAGSGDPRLDLISEDAQQPPRLGSRPSQPPSRVYLDGGKPVWTAEEMVRRGRFDAFIGRAGAWFDGADPVRLRQRLGELKADYEKSRLSSEIDMPASVRRFPRELLPSSGTDGSTGHAISRAELATEKPWLIPELYNSAHDDIADPDERWLRNLEEFITDFEVERQLAVDGGSASPLPYDPNNPGVYRANIELLLGAEPYRSAGNWIKPRLVDRYWHKDDSQGGTHVAAYRYEPSLRTPHHEMTQAKDFPSRTLRHWMGVFHGPLKEVVALKENSDMGLCHVVRLLYRYGTLPDGLGGDAEITWRPRKAPDELFAELFERKAAALAGKQELLDRLRVARAKLEVILSSSAAHPRSAHPAFSPLAGEIVKQGLLSYKFWLDEQPRALDNAELNNAKKDLGYGDLADREMEFWSENHYIMFASSEYLLGQLWPDDRFQVGRFFRQEPEPVSGRRRRERGRARVLKWLHNRLQFGWTEFNSSGYYREHLWALLNLADFALDEEVRTKATIAVDLLLFDVVRYLHKGSMGAPGGRSQFKSRNSGWDNGLADVVEVMLGAQGIFADGDAQIGTIFATTSYVVPEVLLEIGASPPPDGFVDRSRVSITFDDAPKYGIATSLRSDTRDSLLEGYKPKRDKYFPFIGEVNDEIARTHHDYGATEDDTVFFWGMSAYFNKQIVRNSFATVDKFGLEKSPAFVPALRLLIDVILPLLERVGRGLVGGVAGALAGGVGGAAIGAVAGLFSSDILADELEEDAADLLSVFTEGSTRTRANILTYRNRDVMLSSIQNFRVGQLNFQSNVCQATLNTSVNVFPTTGFAGFDISHVTAAIGGALAGLTVAPFLGPVAVVAGAAVAVGVNEGSLKGENPLGDDIDGPSWWTGYWALPMIAQSGSAAIIVQDFHETQSHLAEAGSHVWFPKSGFDKVLERRTSAYDNADFFLLDITDIGPKGFWLFGRIVHPGQSGSTEEPGEAYVGVFSNQRPEWLDKEFDIYERRLEEAGKQPIEDKRDAIDDKLDEIEDEDNVGYRGRQVVETVVKRSVDGNHQRGIHRDAWLNAVKADLDAVTAPVIAKHRKAVDELAGLYMDLADLERVWGEPHADYFADRDWYAEGKNVWILQVGSKAEFGGFEQFVDRVSSARIHLDDTGDMECSYDIPKPGGGSDRLSVAYGDGGRFGLNGGPFPTDLYPRFETRFVRGGRAEWGQRAYCLEWNGKTLLHDFNDFGRPVRTEAPAFDPGADETIKALVIYLRTGDEDMDAFTVATATVDIGCLRVTADQVVAAGPAGEGTTHDAEWIFFDQPARRSPDMGLTLRHTGSRDDTPEWSASFSVKALMGDLRLVDCSLSFASVHFEDDRRTIGPLPLTVALSRWTAWEPLPDGKTPSWWTIAAHPPYELGWHEFNDLILLDTAGRLWHRRLLCDATQGAWESLGGWTKPASFAAVSDRFRNVSLFAVSGGRLVTRSRPANGAWTNTWTPLEPATSDGPIPLGEGSAVTAAPGDGAFSGIDLYLTGADGGVYASRAWTPGAPWKSQKANGFTPAPGVPVQVAAGRLLALGTDGAVWARPLDTMAFLLLGEWERLSPTGLRVTRFAAGGSGEALRVAIRGQAGDVRLHSSDRPGWTPVTGPALAPDSDLHWATPVPGRWWLVGTGTDGVVRAVEPADGDASALAWKEIGTPETRVLSDPAGGLAVMSRAKGQVEVFAKTAEGTLTRTWWS